MENLEQIRIEEFIGRRTAEFVYQLVAVWNISVRTSHHFLTEQDINNLVPQVTVALQGIEHLIVVWEDGVPVGFMGIQEHKIEMLFLSSSCIGKGLGKDLINLAISRYDAKYVDVNVQNEKAEGFYRHMGFHAFQRDETDEQGNPFPILHMRLAKNENTLSRQKEEYGLTD